VCISIYFLLRQPCAFTHPRKERGETFDGTPGAKLALRWVSYQFYSPRFMCTHCLPTLRLHARALPHAPIALILIGSHTFSYTINFFVSFIHVCISIYHSLIISCALHSSFPHLPPLLPSPPPPPPPPPPKTGPQGFPPRGPPPPGMGMGYPPPRGPPPPGMMMGGGMPPGYPPQGQGPPGGFLGGPPPPPRGFPPGMPPRPLPPR